MAGLGLVGDDELTPEGAFVAFSESRLRILAADVSLFALGNGECIGLGGDGLDLAEMGIDELLLFPPNDESFRQLCAESGRWRLGDELLLSFFTELGGPDRPIRLLVLLFKLRLDGGPDGLNFPFTLPVGGFGAGFPFVPANGIRLGRFFGVSGKARVCSD